MIVRPFFIGHSAGEAKTMRVRNGSPVDKAEQLVWSCSGTWAGMAVMLAVAWPASAAAGQEPVAQRTINLVVYGNDACPKSTDDEIVVCARRPESERYRIPKALRKKPERPARSWASRNEELEEASRPSRPGSCSVEGSYGQTGCLQQMLNQWFKERRAARSGNAR